MTTIKANEKENTRKNIYSQFKKVLKSSLDKGLSLAIEIHKNPDPDAFGAAFAVYHITKLMGYSPTITYSGNLGRRQNRAIVSTLDIPLCKYDKQLRNSEEEVTPEKFDQFLFVDHSGNTSTWNLEGKIAKDKVLGIIDHHDLDENHPENYFVDKRKVGSVSTILADYLKQGALEEYFSNKESKETLTLIANALLLGIRTDTKSLTRNVTTLDKDMHYYLLEYANMDVVDDLEDIDVPENWLDYLAHAISGRVLKSGIAVVSVGFVSDDDVGVISWVSDNLLKTTGFHTVYVIGIQKEVINVSMRTRDKAYDMSLLNEKFPEAKDNAGGKAGEGGIQIPNQFGEGFISPNSKESREEIENLVRREFERRIFK